jgi:hypothetical protein
MIIFLFLREINDQSMKRFLLILNEFYNIRSSAERILITFIMVDDKNYETFG